MSRPPRLLLAVAVAVGAAASPAPAAVLSVSADAPARGQTGTSARPFGSIDAALAVARAGDRIEIGPGLHRGFRATRDYGTPVTLTAADRSRPPLIGGALLAGAGDLELVGLSFNSSVQLVSAPTDRSRGTHGVTIRDSGFTSRIPLRSSCLILRSGSQDIRITGNTFDRCLYGISGPGDGFADPALQPITSRVTIEGNVLQNLGADGLQFGHWQDVTIAGNVIRRVNDPTRREHNDGIQIMGNSRDVRIVDNVIGDSTQLIFSQAALGPNRNLTITGNLLLDADGYSVQLGGASGILFEGNTVWHSRLGVIFRDGSYGTWGRNVIDRYTPGTSSRAMINTGGNLILARTAGTPFAGDLERVSPVFTAADRGDFTLLANSPGVSLNAGAGVAAARGAEILFDATPVSAAGRVLARAARRAGSRRPSAVARRTTRRNPARGAGRSPVRASRR